MKTSNRNQNELNDRLLNHEFNCESYFATRYNTAKRVAEHYAMAENAIAVLSNMPYAVSYICYGRLGEKLGVGEGKEEVDTIWENQLLAYMHPDDVAEKIAWEWQFLSFQNRVPTEERSNYYLQHFLRMRDRLGYYHIIRHRIYYLDYDAIGNVRLSLCLYTVADQNGGVTGIIHSLDDRVVDDTHVNMQGLLSKREQEILGLLSLGKASKMIAEQLCISVNTVNNHRQHIISKLHCQNTAEAIVVAGKLGLLKQK